MWHQLPHINNLCNENWCYEFGWSQTYAEEHNNWRLRAKESKWFGKNWRAWALSKRDTDTNSQENGSKKAPEKWGRLYGMDGWNGGKWLWGQTSSNFIEIIWIVVAKWERCENKLWSIVIVASKYTLSSHKMSLIASTSFEQSAERTQKRRAGYTCTTEKSSHFCKWDGLRSLRCSLFLSSACWVLRLDAISSKMDHKTMTVACMHRNVK